MLHRRVFVFVDNDAARAGLIKLCSPVATIQHVLRKLATFQELAPCFIWFSRVPSSSNIADNASRFVKLEVFADVAKKVDVSIRSLLPPEVAVRNMMRRADVWE